ncbi:MAG TPA: YadA-like family protein, partial [Lautropia sp.]|nr:YadA-like family protein [Lautropia sp.]
ALGRSAVATNAGDVALGNGSVTAAANPVPNTVIRGTTYTFAGGAPTSVVSIGAAGAERQIQNVAAGRISSSSTDAVNGSQLFATNQAINSLATSISGATPHYLSINDGGFNGGNYNNDGATGGRAIAIGINATTAGLDAISQGTGANASQQNAIAIGFDAEATGLNAINIGARTLTTAGATGESAIAFGTDVTASAVDAVAMGRQSRAVLAEAVAVGHLSLASGLNALAVGANASASNDDAIALGARATANGQQTAAMGADASATDFQTVAIGAGSTAAGNSTVALGAGADATNYAGVALGLNSTTDGNSTISIGRAAQSHGFESMAMGAESSADAGGTAIGARTVATGALSTAVGRAASATAGNATALGVLANAAGENATAIGSGASASALNAIAMGTGAQATGPNSISIGTGNVVSGANSGAIGDPTTISGSGSYSVGNNNTIAANNAFVVGSGVTVPTGLDGAVVLGNDSTVSAATQVPNAVIGGTTYTFAGGAPAAGDVVSIGSAAAPRQLQNVAAGRISSSSTDAINGSQLFATNQAVEALAGDITNINDGAGIKYFHANSTLPDSQALGANSVAIGPNAVANFAGDVALGSGSTTAAAVGTPSITLLGTTYTFAGINPTSTVSVGAPGAERTITNVAAGRISDSSTDAVNGSQLFATNQAITTVDGRVTNVANSIGGLIGGSVVVNPDGTITGPTYNVQGNTYNSIYDAITAVDGSLTNIENGGGIKYFHANSTLADSTATGLNSVAVGPTANSIGAGSVAIGLGSVANNVGDVAIGQGSTTTTTTAVASAVIGGTTYAFAGATPSGAFSVGSAGAERQIQNVAAGRLTSGSTDAVNGSQLFATNQQVTANSTAIANLGGAITDIAGDTSASYVDANGMGIRYVRTNETGLAQTDAFAQGVGASAVGYDAVAAAADSLALGRDAQANIVGGVALGAGSLVDRPLAPSTGTLPAGPATIEYNTTDQILLGAVSVGRAGAYRQITNVADGTHAQDAVTIRQLQGAIASVSVTPTQYFHANSSGPDSLAVGLESIAVGPRTVVNGNNGIGMGNGAIVEATAPGGTAIGQNARVIAADGISLGTSSQSGGVQSVAIGAGAVSNHSGSVALGAGSVTQAAVGTSSTTINGKTYAFAGTAPVSTVSVGDVGAERTITNVAAGRLSATSTDAVNGSQLYATNTAIEDLTAGVGSLVQNTVQYETNADGSKKNSIVLQGGDPNAPVLISNVAAGVKDTDAVNVKQLNDGIASSKSYADQVAETTLNQAKDYTDSRFSQLNQEFGSIRQEARQAAAIGLAAASLRYDDRPGKLSAAVGGGVWRGEGAFALGAGYTSEDGRVRANLSASTAGGQWGAGAGLSITLN